MRGRLAGRRGCGEGGCGGGRRRNWGSCRLYFSLLLCRWISRFVACGSLTLIQVTQFVVRISFWLLRIQLLWGGRGSCVAQIDFVEGLHFCMASPTWLATNEDKLGSSLHYFSRGTFMRGWLWRHRISSTLIPLLQYFWLPMATCSFMDWILAIDAHTLPDHFVHITYSIGGLWARRSFLQLIWLTCVWVVWNERNHRLFKNAASPVHHLLDKIKMLSFRWLKTKNVTIVRNYHSWWSNSFYCLGIN
jgi:hypothetical protein